MTLWTMLCEWWAPTHRIQEILDHQGAAEREQRAREAQRDAMHALRRALEVEAEIHHRRASRERPCYAETSPTWTGATA